MTYKKTLENYHAIVTECRSTSQNFAGLRSPTSQHFHASVLFTKLCTTATSLLLLLPENELSHKRMEHWDFASTASLTRNIIECYLVFYYLCIDPVSANEWYCRWHILSLHDCVARKKLFSLLGETESEKQFDILSEKLKQRLIKNKYFSSLPDKEQSMYFKLDPLVFLPSLLKNGMLT